MLHTWLLLLFFFCFCYCLQRARTYGVIFGLIGRCPSLACCFVSLPRVRAVSVLCTPHHLEHTHADGQYSTRRESERDREREKQRVGHMRNPPRDAAATCILLLSLSHQVNGFSASSTTTITAAAVQRAAAVSYPSRTARRLTTPTMGPAPGLFPRKLPNGLGSWRVESVVDSGKPNSMFVFLFDDGSGEVGLECFCFYILL